MVQRITEVPALPREFAERRQNLNLTLEDIERSTKISKQFLQAIETGRFEVLPGGLYDRNYVRQYARHIGLNEDRALDFYYRSTGASPSANDQQRQTRRQQFTLFSWLLAVFARR